MTSMNKNTQPEKVDSGSGLAASTKNVLRSFIRRAKPCSESNLQPGNSLRNHSIGEDDEFFRGADNLTKLPDRNWFLESTIGICSKRHEKLKLGLIVLKLSGLAQINSKFGYLRGDALLRGAAGELSEFVSKIDTRNLAARTGSAEFSFLIHNVEDDIEINLVGDMLVAIVTAVGKDHEFDEILEGYYGAALAKDNSVAALDMLLEANNAVQRARNNGAARLTSGTLKSKEISSRTQIIEDNIQPAIEKGEIFVVYQPQFDILNGHMVGMEALARWKHPELGLVPPFEFVEVAERTGKIVALGRHIMHLACKDAVSMRGNPTVSVNLSTLQVTQDSIRDFVAQVLDSTGLPPSRLKLEVTESICIENGGQVYEMLGELQAMGISISLDDFGTGFSALSYLTDFDWDELKIDRSFVSKASISERARHVAQAIGSIAERINAKLTVEGIETHAQRDLFAKLGYKFAQGFLYAKPMSYMDLNSSPYVSTMHKTLDRRVLI